MESKNRGFSRPGKVFDNLNHFSILFAVSCLQNLVCESNTVVNGRDQ
jgi:hypothetical protein